MKRSLIEKYIEIEISAIKQLKMVHHSTCLFPVQYKGEQIADISSLTNMAACRVHMASRLLNISPDWLVKWSEHKADALRRMSG